MPGSVALGKLETILKRLVASGRYNSKSEVIREGIRLVEEREKNLAALDAALARRIADVDAGRVHSAGEAFNELRALCMHERKRAQMKLVSRRKRALI